MVVTQKIFDLARTDITNTLDSTLKYTAVGNGTTIPTVTDTTLVNETYRDLNFGTDMGANYFSTQMFLDSTENNGTDILEVGTFNGSTGGTMYNRALTNKIIKNSSTEAFIEVKFNILIANG